MHTLNTEIVRTFYTCVCSSATTITMRVFLFLFMQGAFHKRGRHLWEGEVKNWGKFMTQKGKIMLTLNVNGYIGQKIWWHHIWMPPGAATSWSGTRAIHKERQHFSGRMGQTLRKKWQHIGIKKCWHGEGCITNSKKSPGVIYGRPSTYYVVGEEAQVAHIAHK